MQVSKLLWLVAIGHILVISVLVQVGLMRFPIATVSIFLNCGPIVTVVVGGILLPTERLQISSLVKVVVAFIGVLLITLGAPKVA